MDAERIKLLRKHLAADDSSNVKLHARDLCELVTGSGIDDEGLKKAAESMQGHVGSVAIDRTKALAMLNAVDKSPKGPEPRVKSQEPEAKGK